MKNILSELLVLLIPVCNVMLIPLTFITSVFTGSVYGLSESLPVMLASYELIPFYDALVISVGECE